MTSFVQAADPAHQRAVYGNRYGAWHGLARWFRYDVRFRLRLLEDCFRRNSIAFERQRVFELGFGRGELLLRFDVSSELHGCEISESAVRALSSDPRVMTYRHHAFEVARADGSPRFPSTDYDIVLASHVLEHVPDDVATLSDLCHHTRPGGWGVFFLPLEPPRHNPDHARTYTAAGFRQVLEKAGWTVVELDENFRYASHFVQVLNWPSRARLPFVGALVEALKNITLAVPPTGFVSLVETPLARLHVTPRQLMAVARRPL